MKMKARNNSMIATVLGLAIILCTAIFIMVLVNGTKKEAEVLIKENRIEIKGQFGTAINIKDITGIELIDTIPAVGFKVYGAGLGEIKKGDFNVEGLGTCRLFIHSKEGPFIYIIADNKYTIMNFKDASNTASLHGELKKVLQEYAK
jgi:hypothetical protein